MKRAAVLLLFVCLGASWAAPVEQEGPVEASCTDAVALGAAREAMDKINKDRTEGYVFSLHSLANAHVQSHGENSWMFYLNMNVLETNCSVISKANFKDCTVRDITGIPVYGQCKVSIFISRVNRVSRLYKYNCVVRPVSAEKVQRICPDCSSFTDKDSDEIKKTVSKSLEKFNKESGLTKHFALLQVTRATSGWGMGMIYYVQYTIQETTCANGPEKPEDCPPMQCEFAHKGFCKASHVHAPMPPMPTGDTTASGDESVHVTCEIYEPEAAEREKKLHDLGAAGDHAHNDTDASSTATGHDHKHDHTKPHDTHAHGNDDPHHHTHEHQHGTHSHGHGHSHDHSHGHDHVHLHHEKAHDHSKDHPNQHHQYTHAAGEVTHHHDHELALDHEHNHPHLHPHEHHHHHHDHDHHSTPHHHPEGMWRQIPALAGPDTPVTLPAFPDTPAGPEAGVTLPLNPDPQIPGQTEPTVLPFPQKQSSQCTTPALTEDTEFMLKLFLEDPEFKQSA